ncbi:hypothetical protein ICW40_17260 [Actinotalea ferrariae]|uniref:hypothetical protein n=1 Tax=Actinotalea ferrariae TaxID=1386098 RepID=UPI001C8BF36A|nr:hypothetical protein [Actinotalea ferrariae]MBX9246543.1 hypothetical protein [Actinotalea ferrariae]
MSTRAPSAAPVRRPDARRPVPALAAGLAVLALGAATAVVGIPLLRPEPGCASARDEALNEVLAGRDELDLRPTGTSEAVGHRSAGCDEDGAASATVRYDGLGPADVVAHYDEVLTERGWTRVGDVRDRGSLPPVACWSGTVDGAEARFAIETTAPVDDATTPGPSYLVVLRAAHDVDPSC